MNKTNNFELLTGKLAGRVPLSRVAIITVGCFLVSSPFAATSTPTGFDRAGDVLFGDPSSIGPTPSSGNTTTWTGGGTDDNWGTSANWSSGVTPSGGGDDIINFAGTTRLTPNNNYTDYTQIQSIFFNSGAGSFTLNGNPVKIYGNIQNDSINLQTINFGSTGAFQFGFVGGNNATDNRFTLNSGDITVNQKIFLDNGAGINVYGSAPHVLTFNAVIFNGNAASGPFTINTPETVVFTAQNTYTGATTIVAGATLQLGNGGTTGGVLNTSSIVDNGNLTINRSNVGNVTQIAGNSIGALISGSGSFTITSGNVILTISGNSYTGATTINAGASLALGSTGGTTGSLTGTTSIVNNGNLTINRTSNTTQGTSLGGTGSIISGIGSFTQAGATGTNTTTLNLANTYSGTTAVTAGTLTLANNLAIQNSALDTSGAGHVILTVTTPTIGGLIGSTNLATFINSGYTAVTALTLNPGTGYANAYAGTISNGSGATTLTKSGAGTQILSGANNYSGATTIATNGGTLTLDSGSAGTGRLANTTGITVNSGGTLLFAQTGSASTDRINNAAGVTIAGGGKFSTGGFSEGTRPSSSVATDGVAGVGALTLTGTTGNHSIIDFATGANGSSLVFSSLTAGVTSSTYVDILNWSGSARIDSGVAGNDRLLFATSPGLTDAQLANFAFFNDSGNPFATGATIIAYGNEFELVPVPEPSTWAAGILAAGALGFGQRRRFTRLLKHA